MRSKRIWICRASSGCLRDGGQASRPIHSLKEIIKVDLAIFQLHGFEYSPFHRFQPNWNQDSAMNPTRLTELAATLLRVALGVLYLAHVAQKIFIFTLPGTAQFFASLGLPGWLAYLTTAVELAGGVALLAGVRVRTAALVLLPFMLGATLTHLPNGWSFAAPHGGWEYPAFWAVTLVVQALLGAGAYAAGRARPA
jgi:putative oxidoreductase